MKNVLTSVGRRAVICLPVGVLLGCAAAGKKEREATGEDVLSRARAYWAAMLANELTESWKYEELSKDPRWTVQNYIKRAQLTYDAVEVVRVVAANDTEATVEVRVKYSVPTLKIKGLEALLQDAWKNIDGQWYHVIPKSSSVPVKPSKETSKE